jgi:hypothetical protein
MTTTNVTSLRLPAAGCAAIAAVAFWTSAHAIADVATRANINPPWGLVFAIDGVVAGIVAPIAYSRASAGQPTPLATVTMAAYGILSIAANLAYVNGGFGAHVWRAVPPITLLVAVEWLLAELRRIDKTTATAKPQTAAPNPTRVTNRPAKPKPTARNLHSVGTPKKRRTFTPQERTEAVTQVRALMAAGKSQTAAGETVAKKLGCTAEAVRLWARQESLEGAA